MLEVHLYGKLRKYGHNPDPRSETIVQAEHEPRDTVASIVERIGIPADELGSNIFVDGRYADLHTPIPDGARIGLFPDDMQLLYKWYFRPKGAESGDG